MTKVMSTFTLEVDGAPGVIFRAKGKAQAVKAARQIARTYIIPRRGRGVELHVRCATITERAVWTAETVAEAIEEDYEFDADDIMVPLIEGFPIEG